MGAVRRMRWVVAGVVAVALVVVAGLTLRGRGLRMAAVHRVRALLDHSDVIAHSGDYTSVVFLHHSTGRYLVQQGGVREQLTEAGFRFWDHDYNYEGLIRPDGTRADYSYGIPDDNTDPDGLYQLFSQRVYDLPLNALSGLMQHDIIAFKSCFPASQITSDERLEEYQTYYLAIRTVLDQHSDRVFIVVTPPPLNPAVTDPEAAVRARAFADWLNSDDFLSGHPNVFTFDLFGLLAEGDPSSSNYSMLREAYRDGEDSHPNQVANEAVGPLFGDFIIETVQVYQDARAQESGAP